VVMTLRMIVGVMKGVLGVVMVRVNTGALREEGEEDRAGVPARERYGNWMTADDFSLTGRMGLNTDCHHHF
jgi:hypothetical protein